MPIGSLLSVLAIGSPWSLGSTRSGGSGTGFGAVEAEVGSRLGRGGSVLGVISGVSGGSVLSVGSWLSRSSGRSGQSDAT